MADKLIRASVLKDMMFNYYPCVNKATNKRNFNGDTLMSYEVADLIEDSIDNAPSVDAVPVVRCKDCKYRDDYDRCTNKNNIRSVIDCDGDTLEYRIDVTDSHFCSYGKQKDGAE